MKNKIVFLLSILITLAIGCNNDNEKEAVKETSTMNVNSSKNENLNISILLDLSDRIDTEKNANPSMEYYKRDLGYIKSISKAFEMHLRAKPIIRNNDQIQIYFEPEPLNNKINDLANELRLSFTKDNTTKAAILKISPRYTSASDTIYNLAIKDRKYIGSDIWGFFKDKVNDNCIKAGHRNILFILTDGYMFHEESKFIQGSKSSYLTSALVKSLKLNTSDYKNVIEKGKYGFIPANNNLSDLEVVVLGINPAKGNPFEGDVIKIYWNNWFKDMKVKTAMVKLTDLPANLDPVIQKYINP